MVRCRVNSFRPFTGASSACQRASAAASRCWNAWQPLRVVLPRCRPSSAESLSAIAPATSSAAPRIGEEVGVAARVEVALRPAHRTGGHVEHRDGASPR